MNVERDFEQQQFVQACQLVGQTVGQLIWKWLRDWTESGGSRRAQTTSIAEAPVLDRLSAAKYLCVSRATFDILRKTEDFGEFEDCGRPKFPRDCLDAYILRRRRDGQAKRGGK